MERIAENLWVAEGPSVPFFTLPYSTRMTLIRLADGRLWVHSPIALTPELKAEVDALGQVAYLIAPNQLHHLFLQAWQQQYPGALSFGTKGVMAKRPDLTFQHCLDQHFTSPWPEISALLFTGSKAMEEAVFLHQPSRTLIVTDLVENFAPETFTPLKRRLAAWAGILAPNGKMPLDWRLSFLFSKTQARRHVQQLLAWQPQRLIMAHGLMVQNQVPAFLARAFSWVGPLEQSQP
ncbi:DUF4336 domain-containing protein [Gallaecimonas xiamenensis]|uniref:DUF4336 domain-containing protein n=1 Tax=Gallaecimonas xiamenensis 3-C-1 TaxID=745411 RepID=K2IRV8_9GAMM|nr:DUF4336 domain-containing protein [Gallaecimonas xiamenensis]EKE72996.1 hypothetical protein B3C1_10282 [Gallaecimonas xiamenensis 3-C-1]